MPRIPLLLPVSFALFTVALHAAGAPYGGIILQKPANWTQVQAGEETKFTAPVPGSADRVTVTILSPRPIVDNFAAAFADAVRSRTLPGEKAISSGEQMSSSFGRVNGFARGVVIDRVGGRVFRLYIAFDLHDHLDWLEGEAPNQEDWPRFAPSLSAFIDTFKFVNRPPAPPTPQTATKPVTRGK
jgi:hypothetical protein